MQLEQRAKFFLISFIVLAVLGVLSIFAIPNIGPMVAKSDADNRALELYQVQTAVNDMLYQSICRTLEPVGPTLDMSKVCTRDIYPLVLADYLVGVTLDTGCCYSFTADGMVMQVAP
ncbi:MAG: hypothetical protein ACYDG5_04950 [Dehalococcoidales bacterium]